MQDRGVRDEPAGEEHAHERTLRVDGRAFSLWLDGR